MLEFKPSLKEVQDLVAKNEGNTIPIYAKIRADLLTPVGAYLRIAEKSQHSFLLESVTGGEKIGRYSFLGADPYKVLRTGDHEAVKGDPLLVLEKELGSIKFVSVPGIPKFTGGAIGYISYDCVRYFEPRTARDLQDPIGLPDSVFLFCDTLIVFDHLYQILNIISHYRSESSDPNEVESHYNQATEKIRHIFDLLQKEFVLEPPQGEIRLNQASVSNVGKPGYEGFVTTIKQHIKKGDIIQAVPSQRLSRSTSLHPFNIYRSLRTLNPSPYHFYIDLKDHQIIGASPELLVKVEDEIVYTHPIAGTRKRGKTQEEDERLADELLNDEKERAEHIMLVDLGRNDVNRVCQPKTVKVDSLMKIERYSHVMHIVSQVSGKLRPDKTRSFTSISDSKILVLKHFTCENSCFTDLHLYNRFDAFRSIFPAGTVSGAPKVRAMEIIAELEKERRGVYAGAVGHFDFSNSMDTCIAIRTMLFKDGVAYLQAGGGIVYDSVEEDEYQESINKLKSSVICIDQAEDYYLKLQNNQNV
ncbi:16811_t:CDS:2 [Acaulospora morrowiae]|uniref:16811_t:CDS:1 n=1 Tax=Acaulospora morrowiae TaxID=94023 RepID=A0A9N8V351_9GLOM|nr:16811_t:CDS:2 [Acaulospora morrowiae]